MGWKDDPYWLKGGFFGAVVPIIFAVIGWIIIFALGSEALYFFGPFIYLGSGYYIIGGFIVGSIIGWIYGRLRK